MQTQSNLNTKPRTIEEKQAQFLAEEVARKAAVRQERRDAKKHARELQNAAAAGNKSLFGEVPDLARVEQAATMACTDMGLAERFMFHYGDNVGYATGVKGGDWYTYNGKRWEKDAGGQRVEQFMRNVIRSITLHEPQYVAKAAGPDVDAARLALEEALETGVDEVVKTAEKRLAYVQRQAGGDRLRFGEKCEDGTGHVTAALKAVASMSALDLDDFDTDADLLNTQNGTVDLRTGKLHPHSQDDMITKITSVGYYPDATHPDLDTALDGIEANGPGLATFMRAFTGMAFTGYNTARTFLDITGAPNAGKTTFVLSVCKALGKMDNTGYASVVNSLVFAMDNSKANDANDVLHNLRGMRLVFADEATMGFLNPSLIKGLVSGGELQTRPLYGAPVSWHSQTKIIMAGNGWMPMPDNDSGVTDRLVGMEMPRKLEAGTKDEGLQERLNSKAGMEAILAMGVREAGKFLRGGANRDALHITEGMLESTQRCLGGSDPLADFWAEEVIEVDEDARDYYPMTIGEWHKAYAKYCRDRGLASAIKKSNQLTPRFNSRGYEATDGSKTMRLDTRKRITKGRVFMGLRHRHTTFDGLIEPWTARQELEASPSGDVAEPAFTVLQGGRTTEPTPITRAAAKPVAAAPQPAPAAVEEEPEEEYGADLDAMLADMFAA